MDKNKQNVNGISTKRAFKRLSRLVSGLKHLSFSKPYSTLDSDFCVPPPVIFTLPPDRPHPPVLPMEMWDCILSFMIHLPGTLDVNLQDPFHVGVQTHLTDKMENESRRGAISLQFVCRAWRVSVIKLMYERLTLCCHEHMEPLISVLERTKARDPKGRGFGWWVREIECRRGLCSSDAEEDAERKRMELETYHQDIVRVLQCTPNLMIYCNNNGRGAALGIITHSDVLEALGNQCGRSLRRLEWNASESPRFVDLQSLLYKTPYLRSLSVLHTFYPRQDAELAHEKPCFLRYLQELRLGPFPTPHGATIPLWDNFLQFLMPSERPPLAPNWPSPEPLEDELQVPRIHSLSITPMNILKLHTPTERFLTIYGSRLQSLRTSNLTPKDILSLSDSVAVVQNRSLRTILSLCPNLKSFIFNPLQPTQFPLLHPRIERIGIFPPHEAPIDAPKRMYDQMIQAPVDRAMKELLGGGFPSLKVIRLRDAGSFSFLGRKDDWVDLWQPYLEERGVRFENRDGMKFELYSMDCMEDIPDGV